MDLIKNRTKIIISDCYQIHRDEKNVIVKVEFLIDTNTSRNFVTLTFDRLCYEHKKSEFEQSFSIKEQEFILEKLFNYRRSKKLLYTIVRPNGKKQIAKVIDAWVDDPIGFVSTATVEYIIEGEELTFTCKFFAYGDVIEKKAMHYLYPNLYTYINGQEDTSVLDTQILKILEQKQEKLVCNEQVKKMKQETRKRLGMKALNEVELEDLCNNIRIQD